MSAQTMQIRNRPCRIYGEAHAEYLLLQMTGEHELQSMDDDGCPVVDLTLQIAKRFSVPVIILCDACASLLLANGVPMKQI